MPNSAGGNPDPSGGGWLRKFFDMPNDSALKTVIVTLVVCLAGSILVAGSAVLLKPLHDANKARERQARMAEIIAQLPGIGERFGADESVSVEARVVDLASGLYVPSMDATRFKPRRAAKDPKQSVAIAAKYDFAKIKRRARFAVVYLVRRQGRLEQVILPIYGRGYGSMLYGYLGLSGDVRTVAGLSFYEHGETPGIGALVDSPAWRNQWRGKQVWDPAGKLRLGVAEGKVAPDSSDAPYKVDGMTGATWTSRGVTNLLRFWLGNDGFGPFLKTLRGQGG